MTDHIELLPLPKWMSNYTIPSDSTIFEEDVVLADRMRDYARANILHHTAPLQAEIEALRAEVAEWRFVAAAQSEVKACAERLADAVRELEERAQRARRGPAAAGAGGAGTNRPRPSTEGTHHANRPRSRSSRRTNDERSVGR
ncbi:MAG: hypothetical protein INH13_02025 [Cupriavidus sp.]|nr:hypothetical protein [Cupriavidus sp.]